VNDESIEKYINKQTIAHTQGVYNNRPLSLFRTSAVDDKSVNVVVKKKKAFNCVSPSFLSLLPFRNRCYIVLKYE